LRFALSRMRFVTAFATDHRWLVAAVCMLLVTLVQQLTIIGPADAASRPPVADLAALGSDSATTIAVLFRLQDCGGDIESLRHWNAAASNQGMRVRGVVLGTNEGSEGLEAILGGADIRFPLESSQDSDLIHALANLGHKTTPVAVVIDRQRNVRLIAPANDATSRGRITDIVQYANTLSDSTRPTLAFALARF
jgi:hypothetical protein